MASLAGDKENTGVSKSATKQYTSKTFFDPEDNVRNAWQQYRWVWRSLAACLRVQFVLISQWSRNKLTFGRWWRKNGKAYFVTGIPPMTGGAFKQPALELYSWQLFFESGQEVRVLSQGPASDPLPKMSNIPPV
jgi:hypothetical protein